MLSHFRSVRLFVTLWTAAFQAPQSMGFSRQGYWSVLPCPPPRDLPDPVIEPVSPAAPALQEDSLLISYYLETLKIGYYRFFFFFTTSPYYYPISLFVIEFTRFTTIHTNIIWWALLFVPLSFLLRSVPSYSRIPFSIPPSKSKLLWAGNSLFFLKNKLAVILEW